MQPYPIFPFDGALVSPSPATLSALALGLVVGFGAGLWVAPMTAPSPAPVPPAPLVESPPEVSAPERPLLPPPPQQEEARPDRPPNRIVASEERRPARPGGALNAEERRARRQAQFDEALATTAEAYQWSEETELAVEAQFTRFHEARQDLHQQVLDEELSVLDARAETALLRDELDAELEALVGPEAVDTLFRELIPRPNPRP